MQTNAVYGLPPRPRDPEPLNIPHQYPYVNGMQQSTGGVEFVASLGLMAVVNDWGMIDFFDPVSMRVVKSYISALQTAGAVNCCWVPTCNKLIVPVYQNNGNGALLDIYDLDKNKRTRLTNVTGSPFRPVWCPVNDKVYVTSLNLPGVYVIDPWTEALHTTPTVSGTFGGITLGMCFCPLNGKLYAGSRSANNVYRIDPVTNAIENTIAVGGQWDSPTWSDNMRKVLLLSSTTSGFKTIDPLNSDAVASLGFGGASQWSVSVPTTGETAACSGNTVRFLDQSGADIPASALVMSMAGLGWCPVTEKIWARDGSLSLAVIDPIDHRYITFSHGYRSI